MDGVKKDRVFLVLCKWKRGRSEFDDEDEMRSGDVVFFY